MTADPAVPPADPRRLTLIGAGPGIGAAVARRFAAEGFALTLVARRPEALEALADELRAGGATVDALAGDAADPEALRAVLADAAPPSVLVYNAALLVQDDLLTSTTEHLLTAHAVDVASAIVATQAVVGGMRAAGGGTVLLTGGGLADHPNPTYGTLALGKVGVRAVATMLAAQLGDDGIHVASITVNGAVAPGTPFDPDLIAETYWQVHAEPRERWRGEYRFDG